MQKKLYVSWIKKRSNILYIRSTYWMITTCSSSAPKSTTLPTSRVFHVVGHWPIVSRGSEIVEYKIHTVKRTTQKVTGAEKKEWDLFLNSVLHGYRRRFGCGKRSLHQTSFEFHRIFLHQLSASFVCPDRLTATWNSEVGLLFTILAERMALSPISGEGQR